MQMNADSVIKDYLTTAADGNDHIQGGSPDMLDKEHMLYRSQSSPRALSLVFMAGTLVVWFILCGYEILVLGSPFTLGKAIGSAFAVLALAGLLFYAIRGGTWLLEITNSTVYWCDPDDGEKTIRNEEVRHFEILEDTSRSEYPTMSRIRITMKSGETLRVPPNCIGDERIVHRLLREKWTEHAAPAR